MLGLTVLLWPGSPVRAQPFGGAVDEAGGSSASPASCEEVAASDGGDQLELARTLFEAGLARVEQSDWSGAEECFRRVLAIRSSSVVSYNLASALARLGRLVESAELLRVVARDPTVDAATRDPAQQLLAEIEPKIGSLTVRVLGEARGVTLELDDRAIGQGDLVQAISVDPGEHVVSAERDGTRVASETIEVGGAAPLKAEVTLDLRPDPSTGVAARDPRTALMPHENEPGPRDSGDSVFASPWLWTGVGAAAVVATVVVIALAGGGGTEDAVRGDTDPPLIRGRVAEGPP